ncbi:MAG: NAD+ synthase [Gammaproteobacteria bacterium]
MRVALAQLNLLVGDVAGNVSRVVEAAARARDEFGARLIVFPELTLTGYPPEDLLLHAGLRAQVEAALRSLPGQVTGIAVLIGFPEWDGARCFNSAALIDDGATLVRYRKQCLPNYAVFDEKRYFTAGDQTCVATLDGVRFGITICEDLWLPEPAAAARAAGADVLLNLSASPFQVGREAVREREVFGRRARETGVSVLSVQLVGGQDDLVFDGGSLVVAADGSLVARARAFEEALFSVEFTRTDDGVSVQGGEIHSEAGREASIWGALSLGLRDYVEKNGFGGVVIGLSGGMDSALGVVLAADALGSDRVHTVMMPSRHTTQMSRSDADELARTLGVDHREISIEPVYQSLLDALAPSFGDRPIGIAEQNLQARARGVLLMGLSNKFGWLVLATGNKSEFAVGYATLYGDMAGGLAPLKDLTKTTVYELANWRNSREPVIPARIIARAPSAELAPDQVDQDSLPPYDVLDAIIVDYIEHGHTSRQLIADGHDAATVRKVVEMIKGSEYKRRQAAPGIRITGRAFGRDRRYPITSGYRSS